MVVTCGKSQQKQKGAQAAHLLIPRESGGLGEALLSDAGLQEILIRHQTRVQPNERKQRPATKEYEREEDRGVNPHPADEIPERPKGESPPIEAQSRGKRLVVQGRHGVFLA